MSTNQSFLKRQKELRRKEKQQEKAAKMAARKLEKERSPGVAEEVESELPAEPTGSDAAP